MKKINSVLELFDSSGLYESFVFIAGSPQEKSESRVTQFTTTDTSRTTLYQWPENRNINIQKHES
jgi:hypothetical protein